MDELKKSLEQLWQGLSGPRKLSLVGSFVGIIAVLISITYWANQPKLTQLYSGLPQTEAAKIVEYLQGKQIPYQLADGGTTILVPGTQVYETRLSLAAQGIPRTSDTAGGVGFELFDKPTFGVSDFMQRANYYRALQGELARTVKQFDEIKEARVMIVVPEERLFTRERRDSKASVFVQLKPGRVLSPGQVQAIRFLVANGVEGLQTNRVAVIDNAGRALAEDDQQAGGVGVLSNRQQASVREAEERLREKAQSMLDQVLGPGNAVVRLTAELNFDSVQQTSERFDPKGSVPRSETATTETSESSTQNAATPPAGESAQTENPEKSLGPVTKSNVTRENTSNQFEISRTVESRQQAVGDIKRLTVAVFLNARKSGTGTTAQVTPRTDAEKKALEEIVKAAVGFTLVDGRKDTFQLMETEFTDIFASNAPESIPVHTLVDQYLPWVSQGFLFLMAIAVALILRNILKSSTESDKDSESEFADLLARFEPEEDEKTKKRRLGILDEESEEALEKKRRGGPLTSEDIAKLIRDNPTNTSLAIKQWLMKEEGSEESGR